jgi:hypothetical protein
MAFSEVLKIIGDRTAKESTPEKLIKLFFEMIVRKHILNQIYQISKQIITKPL